MSVAVPGIAWESEIVGTHTVVELCGNSKRIGRKRIMGKTKQTGWMKATNKFRKKRCANQGCPNKRSNDNRFCSPCVSRITREMRESGYLTPRISDLHFYYKNGLSVPYQ